MKETKFRCIKTINTENYGIFSISWSPEGKRLAVGFDYEDIEIYDIIHKYFGVENMSEIKEYVSAAHQWIENNKQ